MAHFDTADTTTHTLMETVLYMIVWHRPTNLSVKGTAQPVQYKPKQNTYYGGLAPTTGWRNENPVELRDRLMKRLKHRVEWERYNT